MHTLQGLAIGSGVVNLRAEVGGSGSGGGEVLGEDWLEEGAEDELGTTGLWKSEPEGEEELEGVVEWEPVDGVDQALKDGEEAENDPVGQPLCIINLASAEEGFEGVVSWDDKAGEVGEDGASEVEEDEEEVEADDSENCVNLWNGGLLLEVVEDWVLGELKKRAELAMIARSWSAHEVRSRDVEAI